MKKPFLHHFQDYFFPHSRNNHRPHLFSAVSVTVLAVLIISLEAGYLVQTKVVFLKTNFLASVLPGVLVALTNQDRTANNLASVAEDVLLDKAAQLAALDMVTNGYFAHVSPDGKTPWYWLDQVGYSYSYAGENLAMNFTDSQDIESAWMESPTHHANIVKREYTNVGIGVAHGFYEGAETTFVVQFFATPAASVEKTASTRIALAPPVETISSKRFDGNQISTTSASVLGSETVNTGTDAMTSSARAPLQAASSPSWFNRALSSPLHTLTTILTALFAIIAVFFSITVFMRGRFQHPSVIIGGASLFMLISGMMLASVLFAGLVQLPSGSQAANVYMALP